MHEGVNRPDDRHWCAPEQSEGVTEVHCKCGRIWIFDARSSTWYEQKVTD